jgi:hypothetical protein
MIIPFLSVTLFSCNDSHVILNKDPFFTEKLKISSDKSDELIDISIRFAESNRLNIDVNRFGQGKISVLLYDENINIGAVNTIHIGEFEVDAMARGEATGKGFSLAKEYVSALRPLV